jgi:hypothetical protein
MYATRSTQLEISPLAALMLGLLGDFATVALVRRYAVRFVRQPQNYLPYSSCSPERANSHA